MSGAKSQQALGDSGVLLVEFFFGVRWPTQKQALFFESADLPRLEQNNAAAHCQGLLEEVFGTQI